MPNQTEANRELDARVAEMMEPRPSPECPDGGLHHTVVSPDGWWVWGGVTWLLKKHASCDPAADYEVLKVVRTWPHKKRRAVCDALRDIWGDRREFADPLNLWAILYQPGDYSRAALEAMKKTETVEAKEK